MKWTLAMLFIALVADFLFMGFLSCKSPTIQACPDIHVTATVCLKLETMGTFPFICSNASSRSFLKSS